MIQYHDGIVPFYVRKNASRKRKTVFRRTFRRENKGEKYNEIGYRRIAERR